jgi:SAM-dependent methyltransferase
MQTDPTETALTAQADTIGRQRWFREVIWRHVRGLPEDACIDRLNTVIHPNDQMLLHSLRHHGDAQVALSQYYNVALQQYNAARQILRGMFAPGERIEILDFACGYGRLLRFLSLMTPPSDIHASDIPPDAVAFVTRQFGVHGVPSHIEPERFDPGRRFDFIWVASLFSHLPEHLFHRWLAHLLSLLTPHGVLCFSVHDECLLPPDLSLPPEGIFYSPNSENRDLDPSIYGTTYVGEAFVQGAIARATGDDRPCFRIRKGLAHEQDIYIVASDAGRDLSALKGFRRGPWGWVDERRTGESGELYLRGWAASLDDGVIQTVTISIDGTPHLCPTGRIREDVGRVFADDRLVTAGWEFRLALPSGRDAVVVEVSAQTPADEIALLYTGML